MKLEILYQDNHLIAVNKPVGEPVQPAPDTESVLNERVAAYLEQTYKKPGKAYLATLHRIDRPATGIVIFAKTSKAAARMSALFQKKEIEKRYWVIVKNLPPKNEDALEHRLVKNSKTNKSEVVRDKNKHGKQALLEYRLIGKLEKYWAVEVLLKTGRHHQIRAQFAKIGCPIKGDVKYGDRRANKDRGICLHARSLSFEHPVTQKQILIEAPPPLEESIWKGVLEIVS